MEDIRSSLYSLAVISVCIGLMDVIAGFGALKKHTKYIISLVIVCSLLAPVKTIFTTLKSSALKDFADDHPNIENVNDQSYKKSVEISLSKKITDYFSIPASAFYTEIQIRNTRNEAIITDINVSIIDQKYFYLCEKIEAYLKSTFGCNISVNQYFGGG